MNLDDFLSAFPWLSGLPELDASQFEWSGNEADNAWLSGNESGGFDLPPGWLPLGWCDASIIRVRPRPGQIVVMFSDETGREFWQHLMPM
jgi:hypothetical protein